MTRDEATALILERFKGKAIYQLDTLVDLVVYLATANQWRPIETAPKDGTPVLLWWPDWTSWPAAGFWYEDACEGGNNWKLAGQRSPAYVKPPTHWMPLVEPPK